VGFVVRHLSNVGDLPSRNVDLEAANHYEAGESLGLG
jgi:hypothetical protein